jgi:hypothetical protein
MAIGEDIIRIANKQAIFPMAYLVFLQGTLRKIDQMPAVEGKLLLQSGGSKFRLSR